MSQSDVDIVLDQFAATNDRDFKRAMTFYAEDVELEVSADAFVERGTFSGREAVGEWFGNWFATFAPGYHFDITEARDLGGVVLLVASHRGRGRASGAEVHGDTAYLYTVRNGKIVSHNYSEVAKALEGMKHDAVIDGELVAIGSDGLSHFQLLQNARRHEAKLQYCAFDLMFQDGDDLRGLSLLERKKRLKAILPKHKLDRV